MNVELEFTVGEWHIREIWDGHFLVAHKEDNINTDHWHVAPDGTILSIKESGSHRYNRVHIRRHISRVAGIEMSKIWEEKQRRNAEFEEAYRRINSEVRRAVDETIRDVLHPREIWNELLRVQAALRTVPFTRDQRDELWNLLQEGFANEKRKREERQQKWQRNAATLESQVRSAEQEAQTSTDFRGVRERLKGIAQAIRETELSRDDRLAFFNRVDQAFETLSRRQTEAHQQYERECADNLRYVQTKVSRACELASYGSDFREAFDALKDVQSSLRVARPLKREDRELLFTSLQRGFETLKRRREEDRREKQRERERKRQEWKDRQYQRISNLEEAISRLRGSIARDSDYLEELKRKHGQVRPGRKANEIYMMFNKKMEDVEDRRRDKHRKLDEMNRELSRLKDELNRP